MKLKSVIVISLLILAILTVGSVSANDNLTDTVELGDEIVSSPQEDILGESDAGTFSALQKKIEDATAGSTITLENNYANTDGFDSEGIVIDKDLTINGNGYTIDGLSASRIFKIEDCKVTLNNIKFVNGYAKGDYAMGGAIDADSTGLTVNSCTFENNRADNSAGAISASSSDYPLTINSCNFIGNAAKDVGGAVDSSCLGLNIRDSTFNQNYAGYSGGAVYSVSVDHNGDYCTDSIVNCVFENNRAESNGGAIRTDSKLNVASSTFTNNYAEYDGGALYTNEDLFVANSRFTKNHASQNGGAIYTYAYDLDVLPSGWKVTYFNVLIQDSVFSYNVAETGGAVAAYTYKDDKSKFPKVVRCTFTANKAMQSDDIDDFVAINCKFDTGSSGIASDKIKLTLKAVKVKKSAKKLVLTATLKQGSIPLKGKKITFKFNGKKFTAKTNKKGVAKVTIKKKVLKKLKVGKKVKYQASYGKLTVKKSAKVKK